MDASYSNKTGGIRSSYSLATTEWRTAEDNYKISLLHDEECLNNIARQVDFEAAGQIIQIDKIQIVLPNGLTEIKKTIEQSKSILKLKNDWDGEGATKISKNTWVKAIKIIVNYAKNLETKNTKIPTPQIYPVLNGSINISWKTKHYRLLINIPTGKKEIATYYQDNFKEKRTKGTFSITEIDDILIQLILRMI